MLLEIAVRVGDLLERAALPGDLVDRDAGLELAVGALVHDLFREQHHRVMVGAVAHEIALRPGEILGEPRRARKIREIGDLEAEKVAVELPALLDLVQVEAEMPEPPDLERPLQHHPANIVALAVRHHRRPPVHCSSAPTSKSDANNGCCGEANGLMTVTPRHVKPFCMSSDKRRRHPLSAATHTITLSQMLRR